MKNIIKKSILSKVCVSCLIFIMTLSINSYAFASKDITVPMPELKIKINGKVTTLKDKHGKEVIPAIIDGRVYVPIDLIGELSDFSISYDAKYNVVLISDKEEAVTSVSQEEETTPAVIEEKEDNNSRKTANLIPINGTFKGHIGGKQQSEVDRYDYCKIVIPSEGLLTLKLTSSEEINSTMYLYGKGSNSSINYNVSGIQAEREINQYVKAGTYYICVCKDEIGKYTLKNTFEPLKVQTENNDERKEAYTLKFNDEITGIIGGSDEFKARDRYDYYKFTVDGTKEVKITLKSSEEINTTMYLYSNTKSSSIGYDVSGIKETREITKTLGEGVYYIEVSRGSENGYYTLKLQ